MAPALIAAAVWQGSLLRRRGDENAQGQNRFSKEAIGALAKFSGDVHRRRAAFLGLGVSNTGFESRAARIVPDHIIY